MNWTNKQKRDSYMESRWQLVRGVYRGGETEQKGKKTHGHGQQCGDCWGEEGRREINGNGKIIQ